MDTTQIPELLEKKDFLSPLLYKVYKYLRIIYRMGVTVNPITYYFTPNELKILVDNLSKCDSDFNEKYNKGYCEDLHQRDRNNLMNRVDRSFVPSFVKRTRNKVEKIISDPSIATQGELDTLECIFYDYAEKVFSPENVDEIGFEDEYGLNRKLKKKQYQLDIINSLFCNIGNRIETNRQKAIQEVIETNMKRTTSNNKVIHELLPSNLITDYLGGKYKKTKIKNKKQKTKKRKTKRNLKKK